MMKGLIHKALISRNWTLSVVIFSLLFQLNDDLAAQNIISAFNAGKGKMNLAFSYTHEDFKEFYRGEERMVIDVIQDITIQSVNLYSEYGITDRLDVLANIPHISVSSSNDGLASMSAFQDLSLHLKYALIDPLKGGKLRLTGGLGIVLPLSDYDPLVPVTVGTHTFGPQISVAGLYNLGNGLFAEFSASQIFRNEDTPDLFEVTSKVGWSKNKFYGHLWYSRKETLGGFDLGEPGFTLQTLQSNYDKLGVYSSYRISSIISVSVGGGFVVDGRNVGKSYCVNTGLVANLNL